MKSFIDITMTATIRPKILKRTLDSFFLHGLNKIKDQIRLIINIDPIGEDREKINLMVEICSKYFNTYPIFPIVPSFPKAVRTMWALVDAPYIFHLEDDWDISGDFDITKMIKILEIYPKLSSLRFSKDLIKVDEIKYREDWYGRVDDDFLCCNEPRTFSLNPVLVKTEFIKPMVNYIKFNLCPELQLRGNRNYFIRRHFENWNSGIYFPRNSKLIVSDIGREWREFNRFVKPEKEYFSSWNRRAEL